VPTLVIWGDRDQIIPVEHAAAVLAVRPRSRVKLLPGIGHFPPVEAATEVASTIVEFIDSSPDRGAAALVG
jgi:pimeloyl-ACP methyl ester carboxylesterase